MGLRRLPGRGLAGHTRIVTEGGGMWGMGETRAARGCGPGGAEARGGGWGVERGQGKGEGSN